MDKLRGYIALTRVDKPVGIYLVLWPALWALWLASHGTPDLHILAVFILGAILMRSAGCVINDYADRHFDGHVERTRQRPLATGVLSAKEALIFFYGTVLYRIFISTDPQYVNDSTLIRRCISCSALSFYETTHLLASGFFRCRVCLGNSHGLCCRTE